MEQQSNNKLDTLFQKAAEEYPLKTDNKNWDAVAAKLHAATAFSSAKKNRKWFYSALLLLLLTGGFFIVNNINKKQAAYKGNKKIALAKTDNSTRAKTPVSNNPATISTDIISQSILTAKNRDNINYSHNKNLSKTANFLQLNNKSNQSSTNDLSTEPVVSSVNNSDNLLETNDNLPQLNKNSLQHFNQSNTTNKTNNKSEKIELRPQSKTFYGVFFFSPDFSTIKFQHINKPGYSVGVALGYRINNRISAEIGLQRTHSNFYGDGKYFDTSIINLKPTTKIEDFNGNNKLTGVPVAIRYNILKNNHLFATAGTTVALITHTERYDYDVTKNGSPHNISRHFSSLTGTKFFSSVNFSVGYQASVSNIFNVKVEPYYQAATKGLGVGNLPLSNFGVNIGILRDLK